MATTSGLQPVASIASSLARQNAKGEIVCILCNAPVKSAKVWTAHINGRQHREQIARVKLATQTPAAPQPASSSSSGDRHQFAVPKSMKHDTNGHAMKRKLIHVYEEDVRVKNKMAKMQSQTMSSAVDDDDDDDADEDINTVGPVAEGPMPKENVMEVDDKGVAFENEKHFSHFLQTLKKHRHPVRHRNCRKVFLTTTKPTKRHEA
jgi:hypothetical protein